MDISKISIGKKAPEEVNMIVETPMGGLPVKYEIDKDSGALEVDRFIHTPMFYPGNYGFIPHTLSDDGDPVDVIAIGQLPVVPCAVMAVKPIGVLLMEDEKGMDEKIVARPIDKLFPYHADVNDYTDIKQILRDQIEHFFTRYKDLEKGKWVKVTGWDNAERARALINEGIERVNSQKSAA